MTSLLPSPPFPSPKPLFCTPLPSPLTHRFPYKHRSPPISHPKLSTLVFFFSLCFRLVPPSLTPISSLLSLPLFFTLPTFHLIFFAFFVLLHTFSTFLTLPVCCLVSLSIFKSRSPSSLSSFPHFIRLSITLMILQQPFFFLYLQKRQMNKLSVIIISVCLYSANSLLLLLPSSHSPRSLRPLLYILGTH